jgi:hypothetical protein
LTDLRRFAAVVLGVFVLAGGLAGCTAQTVTDRSAANGSPSERTGEPSKNRSRYAPPTIEPKRLGEFVDRLEDHLSWCRAGIDDEPQAISCTDWQNIEIPASVCGVEGDVQLHNGRATLASSRYPEYPKVGISVSVSAYDDGVVYGDLDGDGMDEAGVSAWCDNRGGTAGGQLGQEWIIFTGYKPVRAIGSVTPQHGSEPNHIPYIGRDPIIGQGRIVALESFYGDHDGTCCPTGEAITTWTYEGGRLAVLETRVLRQPDSTPPS